MTRQPFVTRCASALFLALALAALGPGGNPAAAQTGSGFVPVTDAMLQDPAPGDWLMWRRTLDGWGYSPLDQINRDNVGELRMVWARGLAQGAQQGTPLAYGGMLFMPNPNDTIQAIDAVTGDLVWEYIRVIPDDVNEYVGSLVSVNRNVAIHGNRIIHTANDGYVLALDATTGQLVWETQIFDYTENPVRHSSGPIVANGKVISGRSCRPRFGPEACAIVAHDAETGEELWRRPLIPAPGEPGDESWGGVPYEDRAHVGSWMVPSFDPELNLIYVGTSVTSPAPKFLQGGADLKHLYHNSTLALDADTGEIVWYYQHLNDSWDLDHPFERILVDTAVAPDAGAVDWINPRIQPGEVRKVVTGIPGKTGIVYTLDRETGEFLWATGTTTQNVISDRSGRRGAGPARPRDVHLPHSGTAARTGRRAIRPSPGTCPSATPARMLATDAPGTAHALAVRNETSQPDTWVHERRRPMSGPAAAWSSAATTTADAFDRELWEIKRGFPISYAVRPAVIARHGTARCTSVRVRPAPIGIR